MRVVLVEDEAQLAQTVVDGLRLSGYEVDAVDTAAKGVARALRCDFDLMLLDIGLPDGDGIDVVRELRAASVCVPILMLTAHEALEWRVAALDSGADDYLVKPFVFAELISRIAALARRAGRPRWRPSSDVPLTIRDDLVVESGELSVVLSPREHALLRFLARRCGEVATRLEILIEAFGYDCDPGTNVIDVHLTHLRKKLRGFPVAIETVRGAGIRLVVASAGRYVDTHLRRA